MLPHNKGVTMDRHWIFMWVVWAIVEFIQFLRKRPYPARMKTGAWWAVVLGTLETMGSASSQTYQDSPWTVNLMALLLSGSAVFAIYWIRVLLNKGYTALRIK